MVEDRDDIGLHHLRHAVAVAEEGHFGRAARRIGMAQPPLSQSIARLERALGVRLFERAGRVTTTTDAGAAFIVEARQALAAAARSIAVARSVADRRAPVRIGFASQALWGPLPELLSAAQREAIPIELHEMATAPQAAALADGRLDLGLVAPPLEAPSRMTVHELGAEVLMAAVPFGRMPPSRTSLSVADLASDLILFPAVQGPALHAAILDAFHLAGLTLRVSQEATRMPTILTLVAAGLGCALVPAGLPRRLAVPGVIFGNLIDGHLLPRWPLALAHMPLPATGAAARLLAAWRSASAPVSKTAARP